MLTMEKEKILSLLEKQGAEHFDPYWDALEENLLVAVSYYITNTSPKKHCNIRDVANFLKEESWFKKLSEFFETVSDSQDEKAAYESIAAVSNEIMNGLVAGVLTKADKIPF
ncbi:hypothetical protein SAMN02745218_01245 [Desulfofundulus australicus DSM 11792]|uniref:Uncharacterized protein n=1 Tax=Desulfofundulus australicus DSM 11792 TaxID=1121425 RepID=A0A1M4Y1R3_9FIRM|nr:hypothetical protein [Desulfofundulus australicus]SHE99513.1 hypothetical protein SAMN02745218_01245 [Desulfofundulus australicus DSM 11792]